VIVFLDWHVCLSWRWSTEPACDAVKCFLIDNGRIVVVDRIKRFALPFAVGICALLMGHKRSDHNGVDEDFLHV
jgi:hypothetical protein